ncbi:MAG TPA: putative phage abortive infection protein [Allosphingosinicella sp.]
MSRENLLKLWRWILRNWVQAVVLPMAVLWCFIVVRSGYGWNPTGVDWDFENTGQLGDSFGVFSAGMAAVAAFYAFRTYQSAREDTRKLERQAAASSFLNLLERRYDVLDRVRMSTGVHTSKGRETIERHGQTVIDRVASEIQQRDLEEAPEIFRNFVDSTYGLPNLFRFTYHIIAYADRELSETEPDEPMTKNDPAYQNVRLLRAQMSDQELLLIALNCAFGNGVEKFKPLLERYAFLHNMNPLDIEQFGLRALFEARAFGFSPEDIDRSIGSPSNGNVESGIAEESSEAVKPLNSPGP